MTVQPHVLTVFAIAALALALTPGPTTLMALSNGVHGGWRAAAGGIVGASLGSAVLMGAVALGLGSLLAASEWLFHALRAAGVAYLAWLGWKMWRSPARTLAADRAAPARVPAREALRRSLVVALSNPKTALFFAAFLPQFVDISRPQGPQFALLGATFIGIDALVLSAYAAAGSHAVRWLSAHSLRLIDRGCAIGMWVLAATLALWRRGT